MKDSRRPDTAGVRGLEPNGQVPPPEKREHLWDPDGYLVEVTQEGD